MWSFWAGRPLWVVSTFSGVVFGAVMTVWASYQDDPTPLAIRLALGLMAAVLFGAGMHWFFRRDFGANVDELAAMPAEQRRAAVRAAARGDAPADPAVRAAALRQLERTRDLYRRRTRFNYTVLGVALVGYALMALLKSPWWWGAFALFTVGLIGQVLVPRRLDRRIAALSR